MPVVKPKEFIKPCKSDGFCKYNRMVKLGVANAWKFKNNHGGTNYVTFEEPTEQFFGPRAEFKCCTSCKQPINYAEALRINGEVGFEPPTTSDTLAKLKAMKERFASNEGRIS